VDYSNRGLFALPYISRPGAKVLLCSSLELVFTFKSAASHITLLGCLFIPLISLITSITCLTSITIPLMEKCTGLIPMVYRVVCTHSRPHSTGTYQRLASFDGSSHAALLSPRPRLPQPPPPPPSPPTSASLPAQCHPLNPSRPILSGYKRADF
ncbi:hypothetical protein GOP47_0008989, partial [Adiantum capillus-veneris]